MIDKNKLDNMLEKLIDLADKSLDYAASKNIFDKDVAESISIILSVAYERIGQDGK